MSEDERSNILETFYKVQANNILFEKGLVDHQEEVYDFAKLSDEEFMETKTGVDYSQLKIESGKLASLRVCNNISSSKSWLSSLPPVQNQGDCSVCFIFAALAALESRISVRYGRRPVKLSEQEVF